METTGPAAIYRKLAAIAGAIGVVEKDGRNKDQRYTYPTPAAVFQVIKPIMAEQQIAIIPHLRESDERDTGRKAGSGAPFLITTVFMDYHICDGETGYSIIVPWRAQAGTYGDDKGIAKAQTIALRTFLIQLFQIPAVDEDLDPDAGDSRAVQRHDERPREQRAEPGATAPTSDPNKASDKQIKMMFSIWKNAGFEGDVKDWVQEGWHCRISELSKAQASEVIEELRKATVTPASN